MNIYLKDKAHVDRGTATLRNAVDVAKTFRGYLLAEDHDSNYLSCQQELSCSDIQSKLIEYVGRFCERYSSDLICTLTDLDAFTRDNAKINDPYGRWVIGVGIRSSGVDHNAWIMSNLEETVGWHNFIHPTAKYRKVLAIDIVDELHKDADGHYWRDRNIQLFDITETLNKLAEEDL